MRQIFRDPPNFKQRQQVQSFYEPALKLLNELIEQNKSNLRKRGYDENNAAITRYEFQENMQRQFCITMNLAIEIGMSLYRAGKIELFGGYVTPKISEVSS